MGLNSIVDQILKSSEKLKALVSRELDPKDQLSRFVSLRNCAESLWCFLKEEDPAFHDFTKSSGLIQYIEIDKRSYILVVSPSSEVTGQEFLDLEFDYQSNSLTIKEVFSKNEVDVTIFNLEQPEQLETRLMVIEVRVERSKGDELLEFGKLTFPNSDLCKKLVDPKVDLFPLHNFESKKDGRSLLPNEELSELLRKYRNYRKEAMLSFFKHLENS